MDSLTAVRTRMVEAARRAGRDPAGITLVAIGKTHPPEVLMDAYNAGQRVFGENRAQELAEKVRVMPEDVEWHFVGHLQRNKVRLVRPVVSLLHSMDSVRLGEAWLKGPGHAPPVLVEVNVGREPQKAGVDPDEAAAVVEQLIGLGVEVRGLMTVPPLAPDPELARPYFRSLARLRDQLVSRWPNVRELSMGMTDDFEVAIEEGSTLIRVGRAIFGPRE